MPLPIYSLNEGPLNASYSRDQHLPFFSLYLLVKSFSLRKWDPSFFFLIYELLVLKSHLKFWYLIHLIPLINFLHVSISIWLNSFFSHLVKYLRIIFRGLSNKFLTNPLVCSKGLLIKSSHTSDHFPQISPVNQRTFSEVC
jgi:hypothetical protein